MVGSVAWFFPNCFSKELVADYVWMMFGFKL